MYKFKNEYKIAIRKHPANCTYTYEHEKDRSINMIISNCNKIISYVNFEAMILGKTRIKDFL